MSVRTRSRQSPVGRFGLPALGGALLAALILVKTAGVSWYVAWLTGASCITFGLYGLDKQRARGRGERVPETVLHVAALVGGFPGGWAGRSLFHHKTRHLTFLLVLIGATVLHAVLAAYLLLR